MAERTLMLHSVTGAEMSVPAELVPEFEKLGHKPAQQLEGAEDPEGKEQLEGVSKSNTKAKAK